MKVSAMFPSKYISGAELDGKAFTLTIQTVKAEKMRPGPGKPEETKYVCYFTNAKKGLVLSRTVAEQIAGITGSDDSDDWEGKRITIFPVPMQVAGRNVVAIRARAAAQPVQAGSNGNGQSEPFEDIDIEPDFDFEEA